METKGTFGKEKVVPWMSRSEVLSLLDYYGRRMMKKKRLSGKWEREAIQ